MELFENALKNPLLNDEIYDLGDRYINSKEYNDYLNTKTENNRINFLRYLKYICHPKYFCKENLKYCEIKRLKYLYKRYENLRNVIREYIINNSFSIMPSMLFLEPNKSYDIFREHMDFYVELNIFDEIEKKTRLTIFNNLLNYINKNLKNNYVINNKVNYNNYYDDNYTKINLIINNLLSSKKIDNKYLSIKYQII